ncbi:uncharacterized protein (DUF58 family) [Arthrobacter stackebrandtii]|uniref:Uncharacterized protein (DUF58 family) n=1 Tax=Arthrobacter stackebrandtii TaxID=272161 RepID=A0ABS4YS09_9MICC|nr:DUF58 domain-containing protein [Arthrobacter stackebrandtii]MBP2411578.1 uncharacterized protein (DUF58 family) [Arthrobacter stackebrandtii]PYG99257.1 DUF58 domain-containing protein [Arthrobacter stackebrandtii]
MATPRPFRPRGWLLLGCGLAAFLLAWLLGRRDLLTVAMFCFALLAAAYGALHLFKTGFTLKRTVSPMLGQVGQPLEVTLEVHGRNPGGTQSRLVETLPFSFRDMPAFTHPNPVAPRSLRSDYHYTLHPSHRGVFTIGPLRGNFTDPFDVAFLHRRIDDGDRLTIAPAAVPLPAISLTEGRGPDGTHSTRELAHARQDDVMTRDYRHGDPMRRVHWPVTARQGKLMVRAEESVTTPEAQLLLDRRHLAYGEPGRSTERFQAAGRTNAALPDLATTAAFEAAIVAAVSIATHLMEQGYTLGVVDHRGEPAFLTSASAPDPSREEFSGHHGIFDVAAGLAALELSGPGETALPAALAQKLHGGTSLGPLVAVTGLLSEPEAQLLAGNSETIHSSYALLLCEDPAQAEPAVRILHRAGWHAVALTPRTPLLAAWHALDGSTP